MVRRGRFLRLIAGFFLIFALFSVMRGGSYRSGYTRGFYDGQAAVVNETVGETAVSPIAPPAYAPSYRHYGFFAFLGGIFKFIFTLMFIGFIFKLVVFGPLWMRHRGKGHWKGHHRHHRGHRGHKWHGHHKEWHRHWHNDEPHEKSPEDVEPDIRTV